LRQQLKRVENCAHRDDSRLTMKSHLIAIVAAVLVVGCGKPQEVKDIQLRTTAKMGNIEGVKKAIADGANVNARDNSGNALNHATANRMPRAHLIGGHKGIVELLIAAGADVNVKNQRGRTPLYDAAIWDRKDIAKLLFDAGADVNAKDNDGKTPLDAAKEENKNEIADLLRKKGGKTGKELEGGEPVAKKVPSQPSQPSPPPAESKPAEPVVEATQPEPPTAKAPGIPLWKAVSTKNIEAVKQHLASGADVNVKGNTGLTPLHWAAASGHTEVVELLIAEGADVNARDQVGKTPLQIATDKGHKEIAELLIAKGADVNAKNGGWGRTPLHVAAIKGQKEIAELLITKGADVNAISNSTISLSTNASLKGKTPLDEAIKRKRTETVNLLRKHGGKTGEELKTEGK